MSKKSNKFVFIFSLMLLSLGFCQATDTWWNLSFKYRVPLQINETNGFNRTNDTIVQHISFVPAAYGTSETSNSLRLREWNGLVFLETPFHVYNLEMYNATHFLSADIVFMVTTTNNTGKEYYLYYDVEYKGDPPFYNVTMFRYYTFVEDTLHMISFSANN